MNRSYGVCRKGVSLFLIVPVLLLGFLGAQGWAQMTKVTLGVEFVNARVTPLWLAEKEGFFKKQGIDLKALQISGGTQGAQALVSGQIDASYSAPAAFIPAIAAGAPMVEVMSITATMPYYLVGARGIKSVEDLKGKTVGSSGLGLSASRLAILVAFGRLGLDPVRDKITLVAAGAEPERIAGVASGAISGSVVAPEFRTKVEQLGVTVLADLRTMNIPWENDALATSRKFLQSNRDAVERMVKALLEGNAYILTPANRSQVLEILMSRLGLKTAQEATGAYDDLVKYYIQKKPYPNREGLQTILTEVGKIVPKAASLKFEDVADSSIVERLDKSGYIDSLYK